MVLILPIEKIPLGHRPRREWAGRLRPWHQQDQPVTIFQRERSEDHRVDEAEHPGCGADAEGQRQDGDDGESGVSSEYPARIAKIVKQRVHKNLAPAGQPERLRYGLVFTDTVALKFRAIWKRRFNQGGVSDSSHHDRDRERTVRIRTVWRDRYRA